MTEKPPTLFHCPMTRGETTLWMNEELGGHCTVEVLDIRAGAHKDPTFLAINPMGKIPALTHGDEVVTEAAAICAYLADLYKDKTLAPDVGSPKRGPYYRWMFFAPSCVEPMMMDKLGGGAPKNTSSAGHGAETDVLAAALSALSPGPFILGDAFSAADVVFGSTLRFALLFKAIDPEPVFTDYIARLEARPAFLTAQRKNAAYVKDLGWDAP